MAHSFIWVVGKNKGFVRSQQSSIENEEMTLVLPWGTSSAIPLTQSRKSVRKNQSCMRGTWHRNALADPETGERLGRDMLGMTKDAEMEYFLDVLLWRSPHHHPI